jgi:MAE_28990/MAE_18760-like HEPN
MERKAVRYEFGDGRAGHYAAYVPVAIWAQVFSPMTKVRTVTAMQELLDTDFAWRLKEVHDLRLAARSAVGAQQRAFMRAGVALLYAHWEGFVKAAADNYVNFLSCQSITYRKLRPCLIALGLRSALQQLSETKRNAASVAALTFVMDSLDKPAKLPMKDAVHAESNLSSDIFENIAGSIGLDTVRYQPRYHLIDESLVKRRNQIAHGQFLDIEISAFEDLVTEVLTLIRWVKDDLENALVLNSHLAA